MAHGPKRGAIPIPSFAMLTPSEGSEGMRRTQVSMRYFKLARSSDHHGNALVGVELFCS
jgi:hypothetical protein